MSESLTAQFEALIDREAGDEDLLPFFRHLYNLIRPKNAEDTDAAVANHLTLIVLLENDEVRRVALRDAFARFLISRRLVGFLADSGILPATGFFSELLRIASHRLLPELLDEREFRDCLNNIFYRRDDWVWLTALPFENSTRFWHLLTPDDVARGGITYRAIDQVLEAVLVLAYRVSSLDLERDFSRLSDKMSGSAAAFRAVAGEAQSYANAWRVALEHGDEPKEDSSQLLVLIDQCRDVIDRAHRAAKRVGTSLSLTFSLRRTEQCLTRLEALLDLLDTHGEADIRHAAVHGWAELAGQAVRAENQRNSMSQHLSRGMSLLALRVTDNAAKSGEHYITETRSAYFGMWRSAMGAGVVIALLALLKIFAGKLDLALIGYAFLYSLIYGLGFVLIYMLHLTIATKQPAMTAQTIAGYLGKAEQGRLKDLERVVDLAAAVSRSQFAAIVGNVAIALPVAMLLAMAWQWFSGAPMLDLGKGARLLDDLNPLGWALPHAALAGVFLFFSGIISGYFDNFASYNQIGERVARLYWLGRIAGKARAARIGDYLDEHLGGISGNFLFGCMLGTAGTVGIIFGLPIDIRHIAFSSANLGYALAAFNFDLPAVTLAWAALGVFLIGVVNLLVSFAFALWMALRARDVAFTQKRALLRALWQRFVSAPGSFLSAPRAVLTPEAPS